MGVLDDIEKCIRLEKPERTPVFALSQEFDARMSGLTYAEYVTDPGEAIRCQIENIERFGYDWSWLHVDDTIEFEAIGVGTRIEGDIVPVTSEVLPATWETLRSLRQPDPHRDARMPLLLEVIRGVREHFGDRIFVCGRTSAPFSSVGLTFGSAALMLLTVDDRDLLRAAMVFFAELQVEWGRAQIEAGAHGLWFGDCYGASHFISPDTFGEFALEPAKRVIEEYKKMGAIVIVHNSEESEAFFPLLAELGADVISPGPGIDIGQVKDLIGDQVCIMGNLDPINVLAEGDPETVQRETRACFQKAGGAGYLFDTGECVPRHTPSENMHAMIRAAREAGSPGLQ